MSGDSATLRLDRNRPNTQTLGQNDDKNLLLLLLKILIYIAHSCTMEI